MNFEVVELLSKYISHMGESARLLPIVVLIYLLFETPKLSLYWLGSPRHPRQESNLQLCNQRLHVGYRRRTISAILLALLSGALFMSLFLT